STIKTVHASFYRLGFGVSLLAFVLLISLVGFDQLWSRYHFEQAALRYEGSWYLLLITCCKLWLVFYFFCCLQLFRQRKISMVFLSVITLMLLITHFPLATNRI